MGSAAMGSAAMGSVEMGDAGDEPDAECGERHGDGQRSDIADDAMTEIVACRVQPGMAL